MRDLAGKVTSMRPEEAVEIMVKWEEPLIVDVLRRIDADAVGRAANYLAVPHFAHAARQGEPILYLMTQIWHIPRPGLAVGCYSPGGKNVHGVRDAKSYRSVAPRQRAAENFDPAII